MFVKVGADVPARDVKDLGLDSVDSGHFAPGTHVEYHAEQIEKFACENNYIACGVMVAYHPKVDPELALHGFWR